MVSATRLLSYIYNNKLVLNNNGWQSLIFSNNKHTLNTINITDKLIIHHPNITSYTSHSVIFPRVRNLIIIGCNVYFFNNLKFPSLMKLSILHQNTYDVILHMNYSSDKEKYILHLNCNYLSNMNNLFHSLHNNTIIKEIDSRIHNNIKKSAIDSLSDIVSDP